MEWTSGKNYPEVHFRKLRMKEQERPSGFFFIFPLDLIIGDTAGFVTRKIEKTEILKI